MNYRKRREKDLVGSGLGVNLLLSGEAGVGGHGVPALRYGLSSRRSGGLLK